MLLRRHCRRRWSNQCQRCPLPLSGLTLAIAMSLFRTCLTFTASFDSTNLRDLNPMLRRENSRGSRCGCLGFHSRRGWVVRIFFSHRGLKENLAEILNLVQALAMDSRTKSNSKPRSGEVARLNAGGILTQRSGEARGWPDLRSQRKDNDAFSWEFVSVVLLVVA